MAGPWRGQEGEGQAPRPAAPGMQAGPGLSTTGRHRAGGVLGLNRDGFLNLKSTLFQL